MTLPTYAPEARGRCRESFCIYGPSGIGKTTQAQELAELIHRETKGEQMLRLVFGDDSDIAILQPAIDLGLIETFDVQSREHPFETMHQITTGYWPLDPTDPASTMIPPTHEKSQIGRVAAYFYDSGTGIGNYLMREALRLEADPSSAFRIATEKATARFQDGETHFAASSLSHYGAIQNRMSQFIAQSKQVPGRLVVWTFREGRGKFQKRETVYGPDLPGTALEGDIPGWFGNTLHLYGVPTGPNGDDVERRMYFETHYDPIDGVPYPAKNRSNVEFPLSKMMNGIYLTGKDFNLAVFIRLLAKSRALGAEQLKARLLNGEQS